MVNYLGSKLFGDEDMKINSDYPWFVANGRLVTISEASQYALNDPMIYEVIRLIDGKPLFYKEHMARLSESANLLGTCIDHMTSAIQQGVDALIERNEIHSDNIKLVIGNLDQGEPTWILFGVKGFYPPEAWFKEGVQTTLLTALRSNPHAKVINQTLANQVDQMRATSDVFEALLVDDSGRITEGSRSNVFFIKDGKLLTPRTDLALKGITRLKLMGLLEKLNIPCFEADIEVGSLENLEGAFITGTSIDLLPIKAIDKVKYDTASLELMNRLLHGYRELMKASLKQYDHK